MRPQIVTHVYKIVEYQMIFVGEKNLQPRKASCRTATQHQQVEGRCDGVGLRLGTAIHGTERCAT